MKTRSALATNLVLLAVRATILVVTLMVMAGVSAVAIMSLGPLPLWWWLAQ